MDFLNLVALQELVSGAEKLNFYAFYEDYGWIKGIGKERTVLNLPAFNRPLLV